MDIQWTELTIWARTATPIVNLTRRLDVGSSIDQSSLCRVWNMTLPTIFQLHVLLAETSCCIVWAMLLAWSTWMPHGHRGVEHWSEEMRVQTQVGMTNGRPGCIPLPLPVIVQCSNLLVSPVLYLNLIPTYTSFWEIEEEIQFVERSIIPPYVCVKECV